MFNFIRNNISYFGFLENINSKEFPESTYSVRIKNNIYSKLLNSIKNDFDISFLTYRFRIKYEKKFLLDCLLKKEISYLKYYFIFITRFIYNVFEIFSFVIFGLLKKDFLEIKYSNYPKDKNLIIFSQKKRNLQIQNELKNYGVINLNYLRTSSENRCMVLRLDFSEFLSVLQKKLFNLNFRIENISKFYKLKKAFNFLYSEFKDIDKDFKFACHEGFSFDQRLFISFFKKRNFKTIIFSNNVNYSLNSFKIISDNIIVPSALSVNWINKFDYDKILFLNKPLSNNKNFHKKPKKNKLIFGYIPEINPSVYKRDFEKLLNYKLNSLSKNNNFEIELVVRFHPQVAKTEMNNDILNLNSYYKKEVHNKNLDQLLL